MSHEVFEGPILSEERLAVLKAVVVKRQIAKKARYFCFAIQRSIESDTPLPEDLPQGFKEYIEALESFDTFGGWEGFAKRWDLRGSNPFKIVLRMRSVWQEWDQVMERVAIPLNATAEEIAIRQQQLAEEYQRRNG